MSRPNSLFPSAVLLTIGMILLGCCIIGVQTWHARQSVTIVEGVAVESDRPVQLWHDGQRTRSIAADTDQPTSNDGTFAESVVELDDDVSPTDRGYRQYVTTEPADFTATDVTPLTKATPAQPTPVALPPVDESPVTLSSVGKTSPVAVELGSAAAREQSAPSSDALRLASTELPEPAPVPPEPDIDSAPRNTDPPSTATPAENVAAWPRAETLRALLEPLLDDPNQNAWAAQVIAALDRLEGAPSLSAAAASTALGKLQSLSDALSQQLKAQAAAQTAPQVTTPAQIRILRAQYALQRRLSLWLAVRNAALMPTTQRAQQVNQAELAAATAAVDRYLAPSGRQREWRTFLLLNEINQSLREPLDSASQRGPSLARCVLARLDSRQLAADQAAFLDRPEMDRWQAQLRRWAFEPVDYSVLLRLVEQYEQTPVTATARDIARLNQTLHWATQSKVADVSTQLNLHYRNANVRVAVSAELANRLMPPLKQFDAPVNDVIRNARVVGTSQTAARTRLVLFPDASRWNVGLDVLGTVATETQGQRGPAIFFQDGHARFHARKLIQVDTQGIHSKAAFGVAESSSRLRGVETDFDGIPLMNRLVRSFAQKQYEGEVPAARSEVDNRIVRGANQQLDEEVRQLLADGQKRLDTQVLRPLINLGLEPTPVDFETTKTRLITRYRLAGTHQLAAHSPRPQAPSNALLSFQVHESALNNTVEQLRLDGKSCKLEELVRDIGQRLGRKEAALPEELPEHVRLSFAPTDAVRVSLADGRVAITIQIAELSQGRDNHWKNFWVRGYYVPKLAGRQVELVRDGIIELGGDRRRLGDQVALRAIFAKVMSKNRPVMLVPKSIVDRPELAGIEASQAVVEDGWIGITFTQTGPVARQPSNTKR